MRRLALLFAGGALWMILAAVPVFADNGPHQTGASATTDGCAGCHRAHTAQVANLLVESQTALCYTCHGTSGAGATTDVQDGVQYAPVIQGQVDSVVRTGSGTTTFAGALRGGGFDNAAIDTAPAAIGTGVGTISPYVPTTSKHNVGVAGTVWGYGAISATANSGALNFTLTCGSCHDPHGNGAYRILHPLPADPVPPPGDAFPAAPVPIADVANNQYEYTTLDYWNPLDSNAPSYGVNVSAWCSTCHSRYMSTAAGSGSTDSGDAIFKYRHRTNNANGLRCVNCHVAHGSNATMGANSQAVPWPGDTAGRGPGSNLLRINNRGVCQQCHDK